jgi:hypothetical protein
MGFSNARIARYLVLDPRTVKKILSCNEQEYELHLESASQRNKILTPYEDFVLRKLKPRFCSSLKNILHKSGWVMI